MTTIKFRAVATKISGRYQAYPLVDEKGNLYRPILTPVEIGDYVFLGKRINNHHGQPNEWELWSHVVEPDPRYHTIPRTWFGKSRYLFEKVKK